MRGGFGPGRGWRRIISTPEGPELHPGHGGHEHVVEPEGPGLGVRGRFAEPFLLLLLAEGDSHGYELMERLGQRGFAGGEVDPGYLYRTLRRMEEAGLVTSEWDSASRGPIKRTYALTPAGEQALHRWAAALGAHAAALQRFLSAYAARFEGHDRADPASPANPAHPAESGAGNPATHNA